MVWEFRVPKLASRAPEEIDEMFEYFLDGIHRRHSEKHRLKIDIKMKKNLYLHHRPLVVTNVRCPVLFS
ncbi:MAG: hypothetical protein WD577_10085 [Bacteroidales bacterium]